MSKTIKIPTSMNPFVVIVNGVKHEYPAGETVEVPDHIAEIIEQYEKGNFPQPAAATNAIKLVSPGGKVFVLSVSDEGELSAEPFVPEGMIAFYYNGTVCFAKEGMTWNEWIGSDYDITRYPCEECGGIHSNIGVLDGTVCCVSYDEDHVAFEDGHLYRYQTKGDYDEDNGGASVSGDELIRAGYWYGVA
ncbi:MAG: hypothetical protein IKA47_12500 [Oscillospiraceae bacterium]|nr:hypothetical protein [Oscillospiraceae bacterium]